MNLFKQYEQDCKEIKKMNGRQIADEIKKRVFMAHAAAEVSDEINAKIDKQISFFQL